MTSAAQFAAITDAVAHGGTEFEAHNPRDWATGYGYDQHTLDLYPGDLSTPHGPLPRKMLTDRRNPLNSAPAGQWVRLIEDDGQIRVVIFRGWAESARASFDHMPAGVIAATVAAYLVA